MQAFRSLPHPRNYGLSLWFGAALIAAGVILNVVAGIHHVRLVRKLDRGEVPHSHPAAQALTLALFLALFGLAMVIYLVATRI